MKALKSARAEVRARTLSIVGMGAKEREALVGPLLADGGDAQDDVTEQGDQGPAPKPIAPPPALAVLVAQQDVPCRPNKLFELMFAADSAFFKRMNTIEELREVVVGPWAADAELAASSGFDGAMTRTVTYVRPLNIPFGPKQCNVTELHSMNVKEDGGFVVEVKITANAPKGDTFFVLIQWAGVAEGASKTRARVSFKVEFVKNTGMLKGVIEGGAVSSTKSLMTVWMSELVKDVRALPLPAGAKREPEAAGAAGLEPTGAAVAASQGPVLHLLGVDVLLYDLLLLLVLLAVVVLIFAVWGLTRSMRHLADAAVAPRLQEQDAVFAEQLAVDAAKRVLGFLKAKAGGPAAAPAACAGAAGQL